jgi:hypothetical protein
MSSRNRSTAPLVIILVMLLAIVVAIAANAPTPVQGGSPAPVAVTPERASSSTVKIGSRGDAVRQVQQALARYGYSVHVDGVFGPQTDKAVRHWQRANRLVVDGIVGPQTRASLRLTSGATATAPPVRPPVVSFYPANHETGTEVARRALLLSGATQWEADFAANICVRESQCSLGAVNTNANTKDYSWGPWQINYFGNLAPGRIALIGPPESNTWSWERASKNFLLFLRTHGACHWSPPLYCSGR